MFKLGLATIIASINFGFYWNNPAYDSFIINPENRLNPHPAPYVYRKLPGQKLKEHCNECAEINKGKSLTISEIKDVLKRHVLDKNQPIPDGYWPPPYYVTKQLTIKRCSPGCKFRNLAITGRAIHDYQIMYMK